MEFTFSPGQARDCVSTVERHLRAVIARVLSNEIGPDWENQPTGWTKLEREGLEHRRTDEKQRFPDRTVSDRLLDYSHIVELKALVLRNWNSFSAVFWDRRRTELYFDQLNDLRIPLMHGRDLLPHQEHLVLGICGEFLQALERRSRGYNTKLHGYAADLRLCIDRNGRERPLNDEEFAVRKSEVAASKVQLQEWFQTLSETLSPKTERLENLNEFEETYRLRLPFGHVTVTLRWGFEQYDGRYYTCGNIYVESTSHRAFESLIEACETPYWTLYWTLQEELPLAHIVEDIHAQTGRAPTGTASIGSGNPVLTNASFSMAELEGRGRIRADLIRSRRGRGQVCMVIDGPALTDGFRRAHNRLSVDWVLSTLRGEYPHSDVLARLREACTKA